MNGNEWIGNTEPTLEQTAGSIGLTPSLYDELLEDIADHATQRLRAVIPSRPARAVPDGNRGTLKIKWRGYGRRGRAR